ncbi:MAG TPA: class I SAM-dependent methyltransferase [Rugosimonospora sp.]|nr:class I SAM-dependent methyltransferase [Rugosimonospora sp.]
MTQTGIEFVLAVAAQPEQAAMAATAEHGPAEVAEIVLTEVAALAGLLPGPDDKVPVQWDLGFASQRLGYVMTLGGDDATVEPGWHPSADVVIRQDLTELLRAVYGDAGVFHATREIFLNAPDGPPGADPDGRDRRRRTQAILAARSATRAATQNPADLTELAIRTGTDKWGRHWYTSTYERYLGRLRDRTVRVLEIGCDGGESLRMWTHYFRRGQLVRLDARDKSLSTPARAHAVHGAQDDARFLKSLAADFGPFDVVIDDGSHLNQQVITSFTALFPHLLPGGVYVIEDLGASYWPGWDGSSTEFDSPRTTVGFVKTLLDGLHHQELVRDADYEPTLTEQTVSSVCMHHNIVFIENAANTERGAPAWVTNATSGLFV